MKHVVYLVTFLVASCHLVGQTTYKGFIGTYPIELVTNVSTDGDARAIYVYTKFEDPIVINGNLKKGRLMLLKET